MIINEGRPGKKLPTLTNPGVAGDLLSGKQLIGQDGNIITGTIPSKTSTDISVSGRTVTVPAGYYPSQASKSIASATQATPSITVSSGGLITASATQSAGYVASGTKSATKQLTTQAGKTVTPGRTQQTAVASGRYTTGTVYVAGDADLKAANIKKGVNIFGVTGTLEAMPTFQLYTFPDYDRITSKSISYSFAAPTGSTLYGFTVCRMSGNLNTYDLLSITGMRFSQDEWLVVCSLVGYRDIPISDIYYNRGFGPDFDSIVQFSGTQFTVSLSGLDDANFGIDESHQCHLYLGS